jgi:hypothetical protein
VKTGVQSIAKALKTLDSGFRRNDVKKNRTDFFTPYPLWSGGKPTPRGEKRNLLWKAFRKALLPLKKRTGGIYEPPF